MRKAKNISLTLAALAGLLLCACAETPDGTIIVNEETVENFLEDGKGGLKAYNPPSDLNLVMDQPVTAADIPAPAPGSLRLCGTLESAGPYRLKDAAPRSVAARQQRGSTFKASRFGMLGPAGTGGNAWFYADINPRTMQVTGARAYLYGFMGGVCDMRMPASGGFGVIDRDSFSLTIDGMCYFPSQQGATSEYALLVEGSGNALSGGQTRVRYVMDNNGKFSSIPKNPQSYAEIFDYGSGLARIGY